MPLPGIARQTVFIVMFVMLGGCSAQYHTFEGHNADDVWQAMLTVARTPDYQTGPPDERWTVRENRVWDDPETNRIEIFRRLERVLYQPASRPLHEDRQWKFQVVLEERNPPTVMFFSREMGVPAHAWVEADRYFEEVQDVLTGRRAIELPPQAQPVQAQPSSGERYDN